MGFIKNIIGEPSMENFKLAELGNSGKQFSSQGSIKPRKPLVPFSDLEMAFKSDALSFNAINKSNQMIMAGGFKEFVHTKKSVVKKFTEFFEEIGEIGGDTTFEELFESIFRDQMVYGNAFVEKIFDESDTKIVDLAIIDPKKIDYAKTADDKIILDENGKTIGYTILLESGTSAEGDKIPEEYERIVKTETDSIFILAKRICHFKLYTIGDKFYGIGLIEPAYKSGIYKKNMEKAKANYVYLKGFPQIIAYVGNDRRMATPSDIKGVLKEISTTDYQKNHAFPDWVRLESPKFQESKLSEESLKDMRTDQMAALAAPQALVSGSGEACYSEDTLTLTKEGWKYFWEVNDNDEIATVNPDNFNIEYQKPIDKRVYDFNGKLHHYKSTNVDILVTPKHKMFYKSINSNEWKKTPSEEINLKDFKFKCNVEFEGKEVDKIIIPEVEYDEQSRIINKGDLIFNADDWFEFIGYYISEGWCGVDKGSYPIEIANIDNNFIEKVSSCLDRMGIKWNYKNGHGKIEGVRFNNKSLAIYLHNNFGKISQEKRLLDDYKNISKRQMNILVNALLDGDGSRFGTTGICYYTSSKKLMNQVCEILLKLGYAISYNDYIKKTSVYRISANKTRLETRINKKKNFEEVEYNGKVYCYEVPNHLFITSRNGKVAIQGNTNRSTLGDQRILWEFTLKDIIKKTMSYFKKYILKSINELNEYGGVPDIEWGELRAEDIDVTTDKIIRMLTAKSLHSTPEMIMDLEEELRKVMNIKSSGKKPPRDLFEEDIKKKEVIDKKNVQAQEEIKGKLEKINLKLSTNLEKLKQLGDEKKLNEVNYKLELASIKEKDKLSKFEKEKELYEKNKDFEEKINNLVRTVNDKLNEKDKLLNENKEILSSLKDIGWLIDGTTKKLIKEKNLDILKQKEDLIKKLVKDIDNDK